MYNFITHSYLSLSAWGESFLMSLQDATLVVLFFYFSGNSARTIIFLPLYILSAYILCSGMTPLNVLEKLQACCVVIMAGSKVTVNTILF